MTRSSMLNAILVLAMLVGTTALLALVRGTPESCPQPNASSVENLFAPCLVAERRDLPPPADIAVLSVPRERRQTQFATVPKAPPDTDVTGSVGR